MSEEVWNLSITDTATLIEAGELSPVAVVEACLGRIEAVGASLDAFITLTADVALEQARKAEAEIAAKNYRGPMHGIPFGLKDIYNTAGILTSAHSRILIDNVPNSDATTTAKLYEAGAIMLGKLATHEFAHGGPSFDLPWPLARNPWNPDHAAGLVPLLRPAWSKERWDRTRAVRSAIHPAYAVLSASSQLTD